MCYKTIAFLSLICYPSIYVRSFRAVQIRPVRPIQIFTNIKLGFGNNNNNGTVSKFPPVIEFLVQRLQTQFSTYVHEDLSRPQTYDKPVYTLSPEDKLTQYDTLSTPVHTTPGIKYPSTSEIIEITTTPDPFEYEELEETTQKFFEIIPNERPSEVVVNKELNVTEVDPTTVYLQTNLISKGDITPGNPNHNLETITVPKPSSELIEESEDANFSPTTDASLHLNITSNDILIQNQEADLESIVVEAPSEEVNQEPNALTVSGTSIITVTEPVTDLYWNINLTASNSSDYTPNAYGTYVVYLKNKKKVQSYQNKSESNSNQL